MGVQESASGALTYATRQLDRIISPSTRRDVWEYVVRNLRERPVLGSLLALLTLTSLPPLLLFTTFCASLLAFTIVSALLFVVFWIGVALLVLIPTLFFTVGVGCCVWAWGVVWFVGGRWVYNSLIGEREDGKEMVVVKREGKGDRNEGSEMVVNGLDGIAGKGKGSAVQVEVFPAFEDVDCVGLM
ncbi:hypothetical protein HYFRA_00003269, partial [Hymenoscyphus fraxineus]